MYNIQLEPNSPTQEVVISNDNNLPSLVDNQLLYQEFTSIFDELVEEFLEEQCMPVYETKRYGVMYVPHYSGYSELDKVRSEYNALHRIKDEFEALAYDYIGNCDLAELCYDNEELREDILVFLANKYQLNYQTK